MRIAALLASTVLARCVGGILTISCRCWKVLHPAFLEFVWSKVDSFIFLTFFWGVHYVPSPQVVACTVHEGNFVPFIINKLQDMKLAFEFAARAGLPGAEDLYERRLNAVMGQGDISAAIKVIQASPNGFLRNPETIERFKQMPAGPDGKPRVLEYFRTLLETDKLNAVESFELASSVSLPPPPLL